MNVKRVAWVGSLAAVIASLAVVTTASADTAPPLTGEFLVGSPVDITATCSATGASTISYSVSGVAVGPYPGTFTEVGTVTIGQTPTGNFILGFPLKRVTSLEAFFTIDSEVGQVTGNKRLIIESDEVVGLCEDFADYEVPGGPTISGTFRRVCACPFGLSYDALIETETGTFRDTGDSGLLIEQLDLTAGGGVQEQDVFNEGFRSAEIVEVSTVGKATGGGQVDSSIAFGFEAKSDGGLKGRCTVIDHMTGTEVRCLTVTLYVQGTNEAFFRGSAEVNGTLTGYRIEVADNAEPGEGLDRFTITTDSGYSASGLLVAGNIQLHA